MDRPLTTEERATNFETSEHIHLVQIFLLRMAKALMDRAMAHDRSKFEPPEVEAFAVLTPRLKNLTYGSEEYKAAIREMKPAIDHHYQKNSHHPEFHGEKGVCGMDLLDFVEMFCDWKAAGMRHADGDIRKSIAHNANRFSMHPQLCAILENSIPLVEAP